MAFAVNMVGSDRLSRVLVDLVPRMQKEINKTDGAWLRRVRKSAKLRAPRMTGEMAGSIKVKKGNKYWNLTMSSPYGRYQETGFKGHLVSSNSSTRNLLGTIGSTFGIPPGVTIFIPSFKGAHFIGSALEKNIPRLIPMLTESSGRSLKKSGGKK